MRPALVLAAVLLAAGAAWGQAPSPSSAPGQPRKRSEPTAAEKTSHERMLARLKDIAARTDTENPFLGSSAIPILEAERASMAKDTSHAAEVHFQLGVNYLRLGRADEAVASMEAARAVIERLKPEERPTFTTDLSFELGVAALRLAENRNCIARHTSESCFFPIRGGGLHVDKEGSEKAVRYFREAFQRAPEKSPGWLSARWLLNVAHMTLGTWPAGLAPGELIEPKTFDSSVGFPRFPDVAEAAGVSGFNLAGGAIAEDFDGDGAMDLLISDWDPRSQARFLENQGDGTFADATVGSGLEGIGGGLYIVQADYDDDGWMDVLIPRGAWWGDQGRHPKSLLRNLGGAHFVDVTYLAGLADPCYPTQIGAFADYDLDGDLDLFVGNESDQRIEAPSQLFRNEGNGTFVDVAPAAGVDNKRFAKGAAWGDYDDDRYPDLYVSNLGTRNRLYHNKRDGTFAQTAGPAGVTGPTDSFACWFWDYDNDGALDLYVTSYYQSLTYRLAPVVASVLGLPPGTEPAALYKGDGRGGFRDVAAEVGLGGVYLPMGSNFGDLDNDGFLDFYLGTGYPGYDGVFPNVMFWNRGGKRFDEVTTAGSFGSLQKGHGVTFADLDQDGDLDVFEEMGGAYPGDGFRNLLFANPGFGNHWMRVTLVGVTSVRCAIGADIVAEFHEGEAVRSVHRQVTSGGSFGANPLIQHLGLGRATKVDRLRITWPTTGRSQEFRDLPVDVHLEITEDEASYRVVPERPSRVGG
jgi:hypothetical protein